MNRIHYIVSTPVNDGAAGLVEFKPFQAAFACEDAIVSAILQSYCSRPLHLRIACADAGIVRPPSAIKLLPGCAQRIRIGLRLGALQVERACSLILREAITPHRDASFSAIEISLPLIVSPVVSGDVLRAA